MPTGLVAGIDRIAQTNNAYVVASWPANPAQDNVVAYEVVWRNTATSNYQRVRTGDLSYTFHNLTPGLTYGFAISAINNLGAQSSFSAEKTITLNAASGGQDVTAPGVPTGLVALKGVRSASVSWTAPSDLDLQGYQVEYVLSLQTAITSGGTVTSLSVPPLLRALAAGATVTVDSENYTVTGAGAAQGATAIPVNSQVAGANHALNAPVYAAQYVTPGPTLACSVVCDMPTGTALGTLVQFRVRSVDWSQNYSAWTSLVTANTDGTYFDELLAGSLKVFGTITTGGLQTANSGARAIVGPNPNFSSQLGFFVSDGSTTDYSNAAGVSTVFGQGIVFGARNDGTVFVKGTIYSSLIQAAAFVGTGAAPSYAAPANGFAIDPGNGIRFFSGSAKVAEWTASGALNILNGSSITVSGGGSFLTGSGVGSGSGGTGVKISGSVISTYTGGIGGASFSAYGFSGGAWVDVLDIVATTYGSLTSAAILVAANGLGVTPNWGSSSTTGTIFDIGPAASSIGGHHVWDRQSAIVDSGSTPYFTRLRLVSDPINNQFADIFDGASNHINRQFGLDWPGASGTFGASVSWIARYTSAPTGVTQSTNTASTGTGGVAIDTITRFGFNFYFASSSAGNQYFSAFYLATGGS